MWNSATMIELPKRINPDRARDLREAVELTFNREARFSAERNAIEFSQPVRGDQRIAMAWFIRGFCASLSTWS